MAEHETSIRLSIEDVTQVGIHAALTFRIGKGDLPSATRRLHGSP